MLATTNLSFFNFFAYGLPPGGTDFCLKVETTTLKKLMSVVDLEDYHSTVFVADCTLAPIFRKSECCCGYFL